MELSIEKATITLAAADNVIDAALLKAADMGIKIAVAVTDEAGNLKAFKREEDCSILAMKAAIGKAYTAATSTFDTADLFEFIKGDMPLLHGIPQFPDYVVFGGGKQIRDKAGRVVGAIGVAGGHHSQDDIIASFAVKKIQND